MPNWKKILVSGSDASLNTLVVTNGITGSLLGTASFAISSSRAITASFALTSSYAINPVISGSISNADYVDFSTNYIIGTNAPAWKEGRLFYDSGSGALAFYNWEQDVTLNIGQESWLRARNQTGVTIPNGSVVRLNSAIGDRPTIVLAQSIDQTNTFAVDNDIIGMATHDIENGTDGFVTTFGLVNGVNTAAFAAGDLLWVSQSAGQYTNVAPPAPFDKSFVGIVTRANVNNGSIFVSVQAPIHFHDLSSVSASRYEQGDLWMYRSGSAVTGRVWTNTKQLSGSYGITGSLNVTAGITSSLLGTASFATSALSASFATTSISSSFASTASFIANDIITASVSSNTITFTKGNGTTFPITIATGSGTVSNIATSGNVNGITLTGGPITTTGTITLGGTLSNVQSSQLATSSLMVGSTNIALGATASSLTGLTAVTSTAFTGSLFGTSSWAANATNATTATNASNVAVIDTTTGTGPYYIAFTDGTTGNRAVRVDSTALTFNATTNTLTNATFSGSLIGTASFASSSISASFASTASFVGNSLITASVSSNTITFTKGDGTTFPITVATGSGAATSAFPFTGSAVITGSLTVTGSVNSTGGYTGSLLGTASWATNVVNNGVTSVATAGTVSGITLTGGTITSTGTITLGGSISGLTNANLSGTAGITNANLANSSLMVGTTGIALGATASSITGLTSVTSTSFTGSLLGTASYATSALSSSFATSALSSSFATSALSSSFATTSISASFASTASYVANDIITASVSSNTITFTKGNGTTFPITIATGSATSAFPFTGSAIISGSLTVTGSLNVTAGITGSLLGTASFATSALSSSFATTSISSSFATSTISASFASTASFVANDIITASVSSNTITFTKGNGTTFPITVATGSTAPAFPFTGSAIITGSLIVTGSLNVTAGITGSLLGTASFASSALSASFATSAISSSFASTASFVNTLNQNVLITGSLTVGSSSLGPSENTITLGARDSANEGGQIGFNAPGGTWTSASFIDNWSNKIRILRGTNITSTGLVTQWDLGTLQMQLPAYTSVSSFPGTAAANLAVDSSGNVITVSTTGGSVFPYVGNAVITGSLTVTQPIYVPINGGMYFQGGDDAALYDINVSNTMGIYGMQTVTEGAIKLGSNGPTLYGSGSRLGIGTITPTSASLTISGNVWANSFTGSLLGTASFASSALSSSFATTASFATSAISSSFASTASYVANDIITASVSLNTITFTKGNGTTFPITVATGSGTVSNIATSGNVNGITLTGGPITTTGTITLGGTLSNVQSSQLATSSLMIGTTTIALGATASSITGLTSITSTAFTGSLLGTASFATSALSSSFATTSISASFATSASFAVSSSRAVSSSFATTASFASNGISGLTTNFIPKATSATTLGNSIIQDNGIVGISGSLTVTGSLIVSGSGGQAQVYGTLQAFSDVIVDGTTVWQGKAVMGSLTPPQGGITSYISNTDLLAYTARKWSGEAISGIAGTTLLVGQLCYLNSAGQWRQADADSLVESTSLLGICLLSATAPNPTFMLLKGFVQTNYSLGTTAGEPLYIEPASGAGLGYINSVAPTAPGQIVRIVGHTYDSTGNTKIRFNPDNIWVQL